MDSFEKIKDKYYYYSVSVIVRQILNFCKESFPKNTYMYEDDDNGIFILRNGFIVFSQCWDIIPFGDQETMWNNCEKFVKQESILYKLELLQE